MAPELYEQPPSGPQWGPTPDEKVDVFALGSILYYIISGHHPHSHPDDAATGCTDEEANMDTDRKITVLHPPSCHAFTRTLP